MSTSPSTFLILGWCGKYLLRLRGEYGNILYRHYIGIPFPYSLLTIRTSKIRVLGFVVYVLNPNPEPLWGLGFEVSGVGFGGLAFIVAFRVWAFKASVFGADSLRARCWVGVRWTPHPAIVTIRDKKPCIRVLLYSYYATITGRGVLLR